MNKHEKLADLRHFVARYGLPPDRPPISLDGGPLDSCLGGGLRTGALHEIFAQGWGGGGFAACLAIAASGTKPFFWVRPDYDALEYGDMSPTGLLELGGDPARLYLVRTKNPADALCAAHDILACPHVGVVLLEIGGMPKCLDLVASRRLAMAAETNGVTVILLREGAREEPSAALTRWQAQSAPSPIHDDDWGNPVFDLHLVRHRLGGLGHFLCRWNTEHACFTSYPGAMAAAPSHRPAYPQTRTA